MDYLILPGALSDLEIELEYLSLLLNHSLLVDLIMTYTLSNRRFARYTWR